MTKFRAYCENDKKYVGPLRASESQAKKDRDDYLRTNPGHNVRVRKIVT